MRNGLENLKEVIEKTPLRSAPGPSGLTYELLKILDDTNLDTLLFLMNKCKRDGEIPTHWCKGITIGIPKPNGKIATNNTTKIK